MVYQVPFTGGFASVPGIRVDKSAKCRFSAVSPTLNLPGAVVGKRIQNQVQEMCMYPIMCPLDKGGLCPSALQSVFALETQSTNERAMGPALVRFTFPSQLLDKSRSFRLQSLKG